ncbi:porin family protein [Peristeroidobacter agariperforans]|uniref:outer membrane beta-barrel protein n=1 Tax=Peristeroidobacter agariperforans TaxID=268404 RepID=UPI0013005B6F|nr:outer membrane beta-barrel protein [Peristeroidobacter agariperforans]
MGAAAGRGEQKIDMAAGVGPMPTIDPPGGFIGVIGDPSRPLPPIFNPGPVFIALEQESVADETDAAWNVALGYRVNKFLAAELAYVDSGEASLVEHYRPADGPVPLTLPEITRGYTVSSRGPALSVLGSWPVHEKWELFVRGGVMFVEQEVEMRTQVDSGTAIVPAPIERDFSNEVATVGAGVQWSFLPRWTARLEYQRTDDLKANEITGESRIDQAALSVLFGL